ncbi:hypothetical_protein [Candidozyma auris]|uniref:hypothetical_protein n=1 Tax=Candidozyma auris TaxID=498019 RepID=UPI000D2F0700|nr:hypothetical_protein [[Candida] auris]QEO22121.1 hypothetical_protein [[Candida] auris]GBL51470.1 putative TOMM system kinase/cyclase fusion protein [[Candida] auris]
MKVAVETTHARPVSMIETPQGYSSAPQTRKRVHKEVRFGDYVLGATLGEGEFGKVKLGWRKDGSHPSQVAVKLIRRDTLMKDTEYETKFKREVNALYQLSHPNIVSLVEVKTSGRYYGLVLEYASGGELFDYILKHRCLKESTAKKLFAQLVSGVDYMHSKGFVHRDLKLENLLLDNQKNIIITDFGFVNSFSRECETLKTSCGSPCYAAPELVLSSQRYNGRKVDIWSLGVILYAMLAGYLPFDDDAENEDGSDIHRLYAYISKTPLTFPPNVTPLARDLLRKIVVPDPSKRISMNEIRNHPWLATYASLLSIRQPEWDRLYAEKKAVQKPISTQTKNKRHSMYAEVTSSSALIGGSAKGQGRSYTSNSNLIYSPSTTSSSLATIVAKTNPNDSSVYSTNGSAGSRRNRAGSLSTMEQHSPVKPTFQRGHTKSASASTTYPTASRALRAAVSDNDSKRSSLVFDAEQSIASQNIPEFPSPTRGVTYSGPIPTIAENPAANQNSDAKKSTETPGAKVVPRLPHSEKPRPTSFHPGSMTSFLMAGSNGSGNLIDYMKMGMPNYMSSSPPKSTMSDSVESIQGSPGSTPSIKPRNSRRDSVVTPINVNGVLSKDLNSHENKRNSVLSYLEDKMDQLDLSESPTKSMASDSAPKFPRSSISKLDTDLPSTFTTPQLDHSPTFANPTESPVFVDTESQDGFDMKARSSSTQTDTTRVEEELRQIKESVCDDSETLKEQKDARKKDMAGLENTKNSEPKNVKDAKKRNRFSLVSLYTTFIDSQTPPVNTTEPRVDTGRKVLDPINDNSAKRHDNVIKEKRIGSGTSEKSSQTKRSSMIQTNGSSVKGKEATAARKVINFFKRKSIRVD